MAEEKQENTNAETAKTATAKTEGALTLSQWTQVTGAKNSNDVINTGSASRKIRELRSTPGYTNYVTDIKKNLGGAVSSAQLKRYYSNIDAEVYFNGEWVEDIAAIQWSIAQETMPIFGYNSYIYDAVAQGSRIIQGSFTLAFSTPRKIEKLIERYKEAGTETKTVSYEELTQALSKNTVKLNRFGSELVTNNQHLPIWMNSRFDISIVCGEYESIGGNAIHIILKDCYITNCASLRSKDGGVAEEQYSFIARDYKTIG